MLFRATTPEPTGRRKIQGDRKGKDRRTPKKDDKIKYPKALRRKKLMKPEVSKENKTKKDLKRREGSLWAAGYTWEYSRFRASGRRLRRKVREGKKKVTNKQTRRGGTLKPLNRWNGRI